MNRTKIILGIDEVGRGPWAGPLVVGAVILGPEFIKLETKEPERQAANDPNGKPGTTPKIAAQLMLYQSLADSKQLSAKKRTLLTPLIYKYAAAAATGWVSSSELDQYGLSASLKLATRRAVNQILTQPKTTNKQDKSSHNHTTSFNEIIIDGTVNFLQDTPLADRVTVLKKADSIIKEVSAASIIAKVARDNYMIQLADKYPVYGFERHVGYGTAQHKAALLQHGICPEHRQSFRPIREIIKLNPKQGFHTTALGNEQRCKNHNTDQNQKTTTQKGQHAEKLVAEHLQSLGHQLITHNFKTKTYEIDLISIKGSHIYFTEVKYREKRDHGSALAQITPTKQKQMFYAAKKFLADHNRYQILQPLLAVASVEGDPPELKAWFSLDN